MFSVLANPCFQLVWVCLAEPGQLALGSKHWNESPWVLDRHNTGNDDCVPDPPFPLSIVGKVSYDIS